MSTSVFTPPGDALLQKKSSEVPIDAILSEETQAIIDRMFEIARGERNDTGENRVMVGLAAPQIGVDKRIILVDTGVDTEMDGMRKKLGTLMAYINPEITWYSPEVVEDKEGCYSVDIRVLGIVPRARAIRLKAFDRRGVPVAAEFSGYTARIFQHEVDHLNGIRFPDRIGPEGKLHWVEESMYLEYKKKCKTWDCACSWNTWLSMKEGAPYLPPVQMATPQKPYSLEKQEKKLFIGLELRTNNEECSLAMPAHKERFFKENILGKIPNKVSGDILALYTDYEGDFTKPYSWILGCEVSSLDELPAGLVGKEIPKSSYAVFTTQGEFPQGLIAAWQAVWGLDLPRLYTSDFELYRFDFHPQENPEVKVYIAIDHQR